MIVCPVHSAMKFSLDQAKENVFNAILRGLIINKNYQFFLFFFSLECSESNNENKCLACSTLRTLNNN